ncbi:MAG: ISLre2 family transposase [Coriobacteriia bacterium]|nr:ISLre2 family transposase [Coriobacteriia bacterium]
MQDDTAVLMSALVECCLERLTLFEDFARAETSAHEDVLKTLADAMSEALEIFDERLFLSRPEGWRVKDARPRSILTEFGEVNFTRRVYVDEFGDRRTYLDEIVALRPRKRLSPGAYEALALFGSEIPYERSARVLFRHCPDSVSAMTTMGVLRETGDLLEIEAEARRRELFDEGLVPSASRASEELRVEADGIWIALQRARGRGVEVKALCAYEGKSAGERVGVVHHALVGGPKRFWEEGVAHLAGHYSLTSLKRCYTGSDGAGWCGSLADHLHGPQVVHKLDPWHVNRAIKTAFPEPGQAALLFELLHTGDIDGLLSEIDSRVARGVSDEKKAGALATYIRNNRASIEVDAPSMGTMEGTNAHLYAARMKVWGGAWSREGASDMARIRAALASGDRLPVPVREVAFREKDRKRRSAILDKQRYGFGYEMVISDGKGYAPPAGHLMPFSTRQQLLAMFNPLN